MLPVKLFQPSAVCGRPVRWISSFSNVPGMHGSANVSAHQSATVRPLVVTVPPSWFVVSELDVVNRSRSLRWLATSGARYVTRTCTGAMAVGILAPVQTLSRESVPPT